MLAIDLDIGDIVLENGGDVDLRGETESAGAMMRVHVMVVGRWSEGRL